MASSTVTCSECGTEFYIPGGTKYLYRDNSTGRAVYQCCYTCFDHRKLSIESPNKYANYFELVEKCENAMRSKGKTILNPISESIDRRKYYNSKSY